MKTFFVYVSFQFLIVLQNFWKAKGRTEVSEKKKKPNSLFNIGLHVLHFFYFSANIYQAFYPSSS